MKKVFYLALFMYLFAGFLALAIASAVAQAMSNQSMEAITPTSRQKGPVENPGEKTSSQGANQSSRANFHRGKTATSSSNQSKAGEATVVGVNRSGKCLPVHSRPSPSSKRISCMAKGEKVHLNGIFSKDRRWAQLDNQGWVLFRNLKMHVHVKPHRATGKSWNQSAGTSKSWNRSATDKSSVGSKTVDNSKRKRKSSHDPEYHEMPMGEIF